MRRIKYLFAQAYLRLFKGETPLFFKYWGTALGIITSLMVYLNGKILLAPAAIQDKYQTKVFIADTIVGALHIITPFLTNKDKNITKDNPVEAVKSYQRSKEEEKNEVI